MQVDHTLKLWPGGVYRTMYGKARRIDSAV